MKSQIVAFSVLFLVSAGALAKTDPAFRKQKYLTKIQYQGFALAIQSVPQSFIQVGLIDSGPVDPSHPELIGRIAPSSNVVTEQNDDVEHGQSVVGVIAANHNSFGGVGILGQRSLIHYRTPVFKQKRDDRRSANYAVLADQIRDLANRNVDVISISMGYPKRCTQKGCDVEPLVSESGVSAAIEYALSKGVPVVIAAGNSGSKIAQHALQNEGLIVVGASNGSRPSEFSNHGSGVDIYAPGERILFLTSKSYTLNGEGTSYATPQVAAGVAAIKAVARMQKKSITVKEVKALLMQASQNGKHGAFLNLGSIFQAQN